MNATDCITHFPKDFIWGAACASYQCEGAWNEDGKGPSIWDEFCHDTIDGKNLNISNGDIASDFYHHWREDIALMKAHNIRAYRFSVSWSRVLPDGEGKVNEQGLQWYSDVVDELLANGIEPMITLYHWDLPAALQDKGGWLNRDIIDVFAEYAAIIAEKLKGRVKRYMTLNEPACIVQAGYSKMLHAPGWRVSDEKMARIFHILALSHSAAKRAIKMIDPAAQVGIVTCGRLFWPERDTPENREAAYRASFDLSDAYWPFKHNILLDSLIFCRYDASIPAPVRRFAATIPESDWERMETPDFIGINVYEGPCINAARETVAPMYGSPVSACRWPITPEVLHYGPEYIYRRYRLPVLISENGISCNDMIFDDGRVHDPQRIQYLRRYLLALDKAIEEGTPVMGYLQWSVMDNMEWNSGYNERFGMFFVDYQTKQRIPKDSAAWYAKVIATNGQSLGEMPRF